MASPAFVAASTAGNAVGTDLTITKPTGVVDGHILTVVLYREAGAWTPPAGWTQWGSDQHNFRTPTNDMILSVYWKRASSEPANYVFALSSSTFRVAAMAAWSGSISSGDPADVSIVPNADNSTSVATAKSITTVTADTMAIAFHGNFNGSNVTVSTSGYTQATGGFLGGCEIWYKATAAIGATGDKAFGVSPTLAGADSATFHIAIKPTATLSIDQEGFRFRNDDGSESAASWLANQDVNISQPALVNTRLRILVNATGDPASQRYKLRYRKVGDDGWRDLGT